MNSHSEPNFGTFGRARKFSIAAIGTSIVVLVGSVGLAVPAHATNDTRNLELTAVEIGQALQNIDGDLLRGPIDVTAVPRESSIFASDSSVLTVDVPVSANDGVSLSAGDFTLDISIPYADEASPSQVLADGTVTYPSTGASANAVIPTEGGVQLLTVIQDQSASEDYSYDLSIPKGTHLKSSPDGGAQIVDSEGTVKAYFEPAWATDAVGKSVPTRYVIDGNTLTQVVDHKNFEDVAYPVVADPIPVIVFVLVTIAAVAVVALALGVATWIVVSWWNHCRAQNKYPELSTKNGFTARCVY